MTRVAVLGFGLIGGSLALGLRAAQRGYHVTAVDRAEVIHTAQAQSAADAIVDVSDEAALSNALAACDIAVLAMPVAVIAEKLPWVLERAAVVTDCGSTKRFIAARARGHARAGRFVPGHPMAGLPAGGACNATATLFRDKSWLLCAAGCDADAVSLVESLVRDVGARLVHMDVEQHDAAVARTSHLPQVLASALALMVEAHGARAAAGPAFERATLSAGGPGPIWRDIFASNGDEIARAIRELCETLEPIARELAAGEKTAAVEELLARARAIRS
ncbi:MAG: prephenate dehydrogenase/arogenate dehydrogenase family protein [Polyangiaceae bacterium]